ncbi:pseudouridine synthase [Candidatus Endowatersipora endosymbiont of Watersipora subatra]|uniref:pseudouridine synthase n=1 Tax=Candidatus Endowatersipora endosymbiont of Watersipora subatra TaxID=3077946 RepID=UPI00312CABDA
MINSFKLVKSTKKPTIRLKNTRSTMRIAKRIARSGLCSRREAEAWVENGRVSVNGKTLDSPALTVLPKDSIEIDGRELPPAERTRLWLFNKPSGTITTNKDPEGRETIFEYLPNFLPRVLTVGRLDLNTEGLLLLTNDGGLSRILELPSTAWLRRYRVRAHGFVTQEKLNRLKDGVVIDGISYRSIEAILERKKGSNLWLTVSIREGKNQEIKKVFKSLNLRVTRLIRTSYGPFQLGNLEIKKVKEVRQHILRNQLGEKLFKTSGDVLMLSNENHAKVNE